MCSLNSHDCTLIRFLAPFAQESWKLGIWGFLFFSCFYSKLLPHFVPKGVKWVTNCIKSILSDSKYIKWYICNSSYVSYLWVTSFKLEIITHEPLVRLYLKLQKLFLRQKPVKFIQCLIDEDCNLNAKVIIFSQLNIHFHLQDIY